MERQASYAAGIFFSTFCLIAVVWMLGIAYWLFRSIEMPLGTYQAWYQQYMVYCLLAALAAGFMLALVYYLVALAIDLVLHLVKRSFL